MTAYTESIDPEDCVMTVQEFREAVQQGCFNDYDGCGHAAKDGLQDTSQYVYPSTLSEIPSDATHVVWFNK